MLSIRGQGRDLTISFYVGMNVAERLWYCLCRLEQLVHSDYHKDVLFVDTMCMSVLDILINTFHNGHAIQMHCRLIRAYSV